MRFSNWNLMCILSKAVFIAHNCKNGCSKRHKYNLHAGMPVIAGENGWRICGFANVTIAGKVR